MHMFHNLKQYLHREFQEYLNKAIPTSNGHLVVELYGIEFFHQVYGVTVLK